MADEEVVSQEATTVVVGAATEEGVDAAVTVVDVDAVGDNEVSWLRKRGVREQHRNELVRSGARAGEINVSAIRAAQNALGTHR